MKISIFAKTRDGVAEAEAVYTENSTTVLAGSKIKNKIADSVRGGRFVKRYLEDSSVVSEDGLVLKDCEFNSPSIAAMFVTGNASNGYRVWKTEDGRSLDEYLKKMGLR